MDNNLPIKRSFVSQDTIDEQRRAREEEWRKAHAKEGEVPPIEEAPYDPRPLYEKLQEQRQKKEDAFQEATRLANLVHRLDDDEIDFLQSIRSEEKAREQDKQNKEKMELDAFRRAQAVAAESLGPPSITAGYDVKEKASVLDGTTLVKSNNEPGSSSTSTSTSSTSTSNSSNKSRKTSTDKQRQLLSKVIVRKRPLSTVDSDTSSKNTTEPPTKQIKQTTTKEETAVKSKPTLPSLVAYSDDDDSDDDSDN
ncbi:N-terminal domain of NEFA-interacting nuclear protein NIP30-domain-containing protein [Syncephalis plumigaleata]|nr:N-terminal domain of NEFA-interacting nuclear protein NIP30-domain-containing protein [Syncephalis plumigaleata]